MVKLIEIEYWKLMNKKQLYNKLSVLFDVNHEIISSKAKINSYKNLDSLRRMEMVSFIEKVLGKQLTNKQINNIKLISDIEKLLIKKWK